VVRAFTAITIAATSMSCSSAAPARRSPTIDGPVRLVSLDGPYSTSGGWWGPFAATTLSALDSKIRKAHGGWPLRCRRGCWAGAPIERGKVLIAVRYGNDSAIYLTGVDSTIKANLVTLNLSVAHEHCGEACAVPAASYALFSVSRALLPHRKITIRVTGVGTTSLAI